MTQGKGLVHEPQRVTLKAVAEAAKVSPITVSNVVNRRFHSMSTETRERVEAAIAALNYRVNVAARGLRRSRHYCIGLLVVDERSTFLAQPAHHQIAAGLSNVLSAGGYALAIEGVLPSEMNDLSSLDRLSTDALCLLASGRAAERLAMLRKLQSSGQPVVVFHEIPAGGAERTCHVRADDREGGRQLAEHLYQIGCRRMLMLLSRTEWTPMNERLAGARSFVRTRKDASLETVRTESISLAAVESALKQYLLSGTVPDAVIGGNDLLAAAANKFLSAGGYQIPAQVRIAGFGGYDLIQFLDKRITSVRIPFYEMGEAAGREILAALNNGGFSASDIKLPIRLMPGEST